MVSFLSKKGRSRERVISLDIGWEEGLEASSPAKMSLRMTKSYPSLPHSHSVVKLREIMSIPPSQREAGFVMARKATE